MGSRKVALIKLMPSQYLDSFLDGNLLMNTPTYFSALEEADVARSDRDEGVNASLQVKEISIANDDGRWIPISGLVNPVIHRTQGAVDYNMFCMYTCTEHSNEPFDDRNLKFGDTFIVIKSASEFLKRFNVAAQKIGRKTFYSLVEYVDRDTYHGPMGPFRKFSSFSYQNEYRMVLCGSGEKSIILEIGDIRDICDVGPSNEINQRFFEKARGI